MMTPKPSLSGRGGSLHRLPGFCRQSLVCGCCVSELTIGCVSCGQCWTAGPSSSVYEQQAVESCPCPRCGAYTLCCHGEHGEDGEVVLLGATLRGRLAAVSQ